MVAEFIPEETVITPEQMIEQLADWTSERAEEYFANKDTVGATEVRPVYVSFASRAVATMYAEESVELSSIELERLVRDIADYSMGRKLVSRVRRLADEGASDIFVKGIDKVIVHYRNGDRKVSEPWFYTKQSLGDELRLLRASLNLNSTPFDIRHPSFDARLPEGIRVNATHSVNSGYEVSFRIPDPKITHLDDLVSNFTISKPMAEFLAAAVRARLNIIISGGTGAGKTGLLLCLLGELPALERVVTIEDRSELELGTVHPLLDVVELEAIGPNADGKGEVTTRMLMHSALRMHPDRIVVGEARDRIARDMLQAMSAGNDGSISTIHARSPFSVIDRLVECAEVDYERVAESIRNAVDLLIHVKQFSTDERRVTDVMQVSSSREADGLVRLKPLFALPTENFSANLNQARLVSRPVGSVADKLAEVGWR